MIQSTFHATVSRFIAVAIVAEITLLLTIEIDRQLLKRKSGVATYRRLSAIAIISNSIWAALGLLGLLASSVTHDEGRFIVLIILGLFFALSLRAFVFGSVFYGNIISALPLSFVQPVLLAVAITFPWSPLPSRELQLTAGCLAGLVYVIAIEAYLHSINNSSPDGDIKPFQLLQAFLSAWTLEDPTRIEEILERESKATKVETSLLKIKGNSNEPSALIVVPGIHPGPFYPVGSSNLPGDIYSRLRSSESIPLTVHSISDHELNLPSRAEVEGYAKSLEQTKLTDEGRSMTLPVVKRQGKATVTGFAFGSICVIALTQAPYGMEDFPIGVREEIDQFAAGNGFKQVLVIDTHNSEGTKPNESECIDAVGAAKAVIEELAKSKQKEFKVGFVHSSEIKTLISADIGPAGVGLLYFDLGETTFCFVIVDANNSKIGFREEVLQKFERSTGKKILEMCTSDTHVTAAKTTTAKGYLALGDVIPTDDFAAMLVSLFGAAKSRLALGSFSASSVASDVKTIGSEMLEDFSGLTDSTLSAAKRGAKLLAVLGVALIIIVAII